LFFNTLFDHLKRPAAAFTPNIIILTERGPWLYEKGMLRHQHIADGIDRHWLRGFRARQEFRPF